MKKTLFIVFGLLLSVVSCSSENETEEYRHPDCTINFVNYNGDHLYETTVPYHGTAVYKGKTPTRPTVGYTSYKFKGWDRDLTYVEYSFTTQAQYEVIHDKSDPEYTNITTIHMNGENDISSISYSGLNEEELIFPDYYNGFPIWSLGKDRNDNTTREFVSGSILSKKIKFPTGAQIIGNRAFWGYKRGFAFESVELPKECKEVRKWAFRNNSKLKSITLNEKLETIEELAFAEIGGIKSLVLNKNLKTIGDSAFFAAFNNEVSISIYVPKSVQNIGEYAFKDTDYVRVGYGEYEEQPANITFYCEAESKPYGWSDKWNWYDTKQGYNKPAPAYETYWGESYPY